MAQIRQNTDKEYPCLRCGSLGNIVREGDDPRVKCNSCNFTYQASDSVAAKEAGQIPEGPPKSAAENSREIKSKDPVLPPKTEYVPKEGSGNVISIPRTPSYLIIAKNRSEFEFATKKTLKKTVLKWESQERNFDVYELTPKQVEAKLSIS